VQRIEINRLGVEKCGCGEEGEAGETEEVLEADLDLGLVARTRADFPVLPDRRL